MKWIVNPNIIDRMMGSSFTMFQFTQEYFDDAWKPLYARYHKTDEFHIDYDDINHICDFAKDVILIKKGIDPLNGPFITYSRSRNRNEQHSLALSKNYITFITFDNSPLTKEQYAYLLFVKVEEDDMKDIDIETHESDEEDEKSCDVDVPDTRIRGLIQAKTEYSFDTDKLTLNHPYRIRFLQDLVIFDQHFKVHDEIYAILSRASDTSLRFATAGTVIHDNRIAAPLELTPDMKFELDKLVSR